MQRHSGQLRLVYDAPKPSFSDSPADDTRKVFDHWLFMFDKNPKRCKLGPQRRQVINAALSLYGLETLELAIEGMASDPLETCTDTMRESMVDLEWILAKESRIERYAARGEKLRESAARRRIEVVKLATEAPLSPEDQAEQLRQAQEAREHLRQFAQQVRARGVV